MGSHSSHAPEVSDVVAALSDECSNVINISIEINFATKPYYLPKDNAISPWAEDCLNRSQSVMDI